MSILITSFGPFGGLEVNPSQQVMTEVAGQQAGRPGLRFCCLPVGFAAVDAWVAGIREDSPGLLIHLGVARNCAQMRLGLQARNWAEGRDADGVDCPGREIVLNGPGRLSCSFPLDPLKELRQGQTERIVFSEDAGTYLCNYLYYRSLHRFGPQGIPVLFVHIADPGRPESPSVAEQASWVTSLLDGPQGCPVKK